MKENLPAFFGFQAVGVLMLNKTDGVFFSDPDSAVEKKKKGDDDDEDEKKEKGEEKNNKNKNGPKELTEKEK